MEYLEFRVFVDYIFKLMKVLTNCKNFSYDFDKFVLKIFNPELYTFF